MKIRPAWAEVNLSAIAHNIREIRRITNPESRICAVVKANGYGHGAVEVSRAALANGVDYLAVAVLDEAIELREAGIEAPILILGHSPEYYAEELVRYNVTQTVFEYQMALALSEAATKAGKAAKIHLKIDTGMGRIGFIPDDESIATIKKISQLPNILPEGIFTHFAVSDIPDKTFTTEQLQKFLRFVEELKKEGITFPLRHVANSAAIIDLPETHLDMVRAGISIYGLYPSEGVARQRINLIPAMSLKARIVHLKKVPFGTTISYGRTWTASRESTIATIPLGYGDGYTRLLSNMGEVLVHGQRANIIGRVCMDQCMADVSGIPDVGLNDEVVLFGTQEGASIPVEMLAAKLGTINYEIVCMLNDRLPRIYIQ